MRNIEFSAETVLKYLTNLSSTSLGPDTIPPNILKTATHSLAYPISITFNCLYSTGVLPKDWLQAKNTVTTYCYALTFS